MITQDNMQIRELGPKDLITENGFYRLSMDRHHNQPCDGISVTSSVLRTLELGTPSDVWSFHALNEDRMEKDQTEAMRMGRAIASFIEGGPEELEKHFYVLPANKPNKPTEAQRNAYLKGAGTEAGIRSIEFWAKVDADPRDVITESSWELICNMGKALMKDPAAAAALGGEPEITMAWFDERSGLWCLARPDQVQFTGMVSDYKKISTQGAYMSGSMCDRKITQYGYHAQMAFACEGFQVLTGEWPEQVGLIFQMDSKPYHSILRGIDEESLSIGMFQNDRARMRFRECLNSENWPGPGEHIANYHMPEWLHERLTKEMQEGSAT